jgi:hypothetical protein
MIYPRVLNGVGKWYGVQQIRQPAALAREASFVKRETFLRKSTRQSYVSPFTVLESGENYRGTFWL